MSPASGDGSKVRTAYGFRKLLVSNQVMSPASGDRAGAALAVDPDQAGFQSSDVTSEW